MCEISSTSRMALCAATTAFDEPDHLWSLTDLVHSPTSAQDHAVAEIGEPVRHERTELLIEAEAPDRGCPLPFRHDDIAVDNRQTQSR